MKKIFFGILIVLVTGVFSIFADGAEFDSNWYKTSEAIRIADNYLHFQRNVGGWPKDIAMDKKLSDHERKLAEYSKKLMDATIDNNATTSQLEYIARVYTATKQERFKGGALKAIDYLLDAQYDNGGWPQVFPVSSAKIYSNAITYNDDAMMRVMQLFCNIRDGHTEYAFVDDNRKAKISKAIEKGIDCILKTQITIKGVKTAWCAQHDEKTFEPVIARSYELPSVSGSESVGVIQFLMEIKNPGPEIIEAVQSAIAWFDKVKIPGIKVAAINDDQGPDRVVVKDSSAGPLWGRFYDLETEQAFFCGRDGIKKKTMSEIERERRTGYSWYTDKPLLLINELYPNWQKQYAPQKNVLKK